MSCHVLFNHQAVFSSHLALCILGVWLKHAGHIMPQYSLLDFFPACTFTLFQLGLACCSVGVPTLACSRWPNAMFAIDIVSQQKISSARFWTIY
jgi:hypothetical protein